MENQEKNKKILNTIVSLVVDGSFSDVYREDIFGKETPEKSGNTEPKTESNNSVNGDCVQNYRRLIEGGIPYNIYLCLESGFNNDCSNGKGYIPLLNEDEEIATVQKLYLKTVVDIIKRSKNKEDVIGTAVSGFINVRNEYNKTNCTEKATTEALEYYREFCKKEALDWSLLIEDRTLEYLNWDRIKNMYGREERYIYPIGTLKKCSQLTHCNFGCRTEAKIILGIPFSIK